MKDAVNIAKPNISDESPDRLAEAAERLRDGAKQTASAIGEVVGGLTEKVGDEVSRRAGEARTAIADQGARLGEALRDASERHDIAHIPQRIVDEAVGQASALATRVTSRTIPAVMSDAAAFARRHPVATGVGVAVTAFMLAQLWRAGGSDDKAAARDMDRDANARGSASPIPAYADHDRI